MLPRRPVLQRAYDLSDGEYATLLSERWSRHERRLWVGWAKGAVVDLDKPAGSIDGAPEWKHRHPSRAERIELAPLRPGEAMSLWPMATVARVMGARR